MWLFKSPFGHEVCTDRFDGSVIEGAANRLINAGLLLSDRLKTPIKMFPDFDTINCSCEAL